MSEWLLSVNEKGWTNLNKLRLGVIGHIRQLWTTMFHMEMSGTFLDDELGLDRWKHWNSGQSFISVCQYTSQIDNKTRDTNQNQSVRMSWRILSSFMQFDADEMFWKFKYWLKVSSTKTLILLVKSLPLLVAEACKQNKLRLLHKAFTISYKFAIWCSWNVKEKFKSIHLEKCHCHKLQWVNEIIQGCTLLGKAFKISSHDSTEPHLIATI